MVYTWYKETWNKVKSPIKITSVHLDYFYFYFFAESLSIYLLKVSRSTFC